MSTLEGSSSRIIRHRVSSDEYFEMKLNELELYSSLDPSSYINLSFRRRSFLEFSSSLLFVKIKNSDMVEILKKVEKYVTSSGEDMEYKLKSMFEEGNKKRWLGIKPGTVRIFSNELICYYTGKNWRKFKTK
jgi:hypothetical protein